MGYVALYREWRPQRFSDIVGQEHISRTLQNAIATNRIAHAYLFCGPRGTGKTTTAKVLAKALNCLNRIDNEPCNKCENCKRVNQGTSMDVMEIDAASNRGIDEIRDLREKVKFAPSEGTYRIYIIDEVHMLTTEAFNALLKTLEEPPAHVIFVLATTEPHKILLTILSRCQRFDFRRIGVKDIVGRLQMVVEELGIKAEEEALGLIARTAEGGMRDALSVLDQCISFGGQHVTLDNVNAVLGTVNAEFLLKMAECFQHYDITEALKLVDELVRQGKDVRQFTKDLTHYFRNLLLIEVCNDVDEIVPVSKEALKIMQEIASGLGKKRILSLIELFTSTEREMKWTSQPRLILELAVIRAGDQNINSEFELLANRITQLEGMLAQVQVAPATAKSKSLKNVNPVKNEKVAEKSVPEPTPSQSLQSVDTDTVKKSWQEILERIKKVRMSARAFLIEGVPIGVEDGALVLSFPSEYSFHKEKVEQAENRNAIEQVLLEVTGANLRLKCKFEHELIKKQSGTPKSETAGESLVEEAIRIFGGNVVEVKD